MPTTLYAKARQAFLDGNIALGTDDIRAIGVDINDYGMAVTAATNATPIAITVTGHGLTTGDEVVITRVAGNTAANGVWTVTVTGANTFTLDDSVGNGAYTSGGFLIKTGLDEFLSSIPSGARIGATPALTGKTTTLGVFDAADATMPSVTGDPFEAIVVYKHTGNDATARLINYKDEEPDGDPLLITPDGGNVAITWATEGIFAI